MLLIYNETGKEVSLISRTRNSAEEVVLTVKDDIGESLLSKTVLRATHPVLKEAITHRYKKELKLTSTLNRQFLQIRKTQKCKRPRTVYDPSNNDVIFIGANEYNETPKKKPKNKIVLILQEDSTFHGIDTMFYEKPVETKGNGVKLITLYPRYGFWKLLRYPAYFAVMNPNTHTGTKISLSWDSTISGKQQEIIMNSLKTEPIDRVPRMKPQKPSKNTKPTGGYKKPNASYKKNAGGSGKGKPGTKKPYKSSYSNSKNSFGGGSQKKQNPKGTKRK